MKSRRKKNIFIVPKILLFPDLLFVHCVTFRENKQTKNTVVCFGRPRQSFWTSVLFFVTFVGFWELARLLGNSGTDGWSRDRGFELDLSCPNTSVDKDHGWPVTVEINVMYIFKGLSCVCVVGEEGWGKISWSDCYRSVPSTKFVAARIEFERITLVRNYSVPRIQ